MLRGNFSSSNPSITKVKRDSPPSEQQQQQQQTSSTNANSNLKNNKILQQDRDDDAEDLLIFKDPANGLDFPAFEPHGAEARKRQKRQLKKAKQVFNEIRSAPAVIAIQAPLEPDRPAWKSVSTVQHHDAPPLDLRAEKYATLLEKQQHNGMSPNAYLLEKTRPRWVSIAETKIVSGCPSQGIPLHEAENPSAVSARKSEKRSTSRSKTSTARGISSSSAAATPRSGAAVTNNNNNNKNNNKMVNSEVEMSRSIKKLLSNQDAQAAGTRTHLHREEKVLSFLKESTKAQAEIIRMVIHPGEIQDHNAHNVDAFLSTSSRNFRRMLLEKEEEKRKKLLKDAEMLQQQQTQKGREKSVQIKDEEPIITFEDLTKPKDTSFSLPAINQHKKNNNNNNNNNNNKNEFAASMSMRNRKSVSQLALEADALLNQSKRLTSSLNYGGDVVTAVGDASGSAAAAAAAAMLSSDCNSPTTTTTTTSGRKILVRLPKVGLQLFGAK